MKKLLPVFFCFTLSVATAQITITENDMPQAGDTLRLSTTNDQWSIDPTLTGTNYAWDFSFLVPLSQRVDTCHPVNTMPTVFQIFFNSALYPNHRSSYAMRGPDISIPGFFTLENVYFFYRSDAEGHKNAGIGANFNGIPLGVRNNPIDTIYSFPLTYNKQYTSYSELSLTLPSLGAYRQRKWVSAVVDGWGDLTTPFGTFQTLRVKLEIDTEDSIYVDQLGTGFAFNRPTETQYHWLGEGPEAPLLQISSISGTITTVTYRDSLRPYLLSVESHQAPAAIRIFPNPTQDLFWLSNDEGWAKDAIAEIYTLQGALVKSQRLETGSLSTRIDAQGMANGTYLLRVKSANRNYTPQRFIVLQAGK